MRQEDKNEERSGGGLARRYLGGTRLWTDMLKARYHLVSAWGRVTRGARRIYGAAAWRSQKVAFRIMPRKAIYRVLQSQNFYGARYFDAAKDPSKESGYGDAYSDIDEFHDVASISRDVLGASRALDVGCAKGFQVMALRDVGIEAWGVDISEYAVHTAPKEILPWLKVGECSDIDFPDGYFDLVLAMEVLEHIPPTEILGAIGELRRISSRWIWATIPSYGCNEFGPDGCVEGKVQPRHLELYNNVPIDLAAFRHLTRDVYGLPIHGHLITASFDWWTSVFTLNGLARRGDMEREINRVLKPAAEGLWNCMVFEKVDEHAGASPEPKLVDIGLEREEGGPWTSRPFSLPRGIHHFDLSLRVIWMDWRKPDDQRMIAVKCRSEDGSIINATRLLSFGEARKIKRGDRLEFTLPCSVPADEAAILEISTTVESRLEPGAAVATIAAEPRLPA